MSITASFAYLDLLLYLHRNKYEHPREQLIILVHWTFLSRNFKNVNDDEINNNFGHVNDDEVRNNFRHVNYAEVRNSYFVLVD